LGRRKGPNLSMASRPKSIAKTPAFPKLTNSAHSVESDCTADYNCIAFAADVIDHKYWPTFHPDYTWPAGLPKTETLESFITMFESLGYQQVKDKTGGDFRKGYEQIAIYTDANGKPTHASKQVDKTMWASKLGDSYDIKHKIDAVSGGLYGRIAVFMRRKRAKKP